MHEDQTCGVPGRSIFSNLNLIRDPIEYCNSKNLTLAIISLDQEKAFDMVNWIFLDRVLQRMNFGPEFRQWIRVIYTNISSACLHSGFVTSFFEINREPAKVTLFPACYIPWLRRCWGQLLEIARTSGGVRLPGSSKESKISQYADDGNLTLVDEYSITKAFEIVRIFEKGSGSKLNLAKTEGMWFEIVRTSGGVRLPGSSKESKISQYADDGNLTLVDEYSITKAFEIVRIFEKGSGSKLNLAKTEGMWFSSMAGRTDGPVNIKWRTDFIKVLVIFFTMSNCDFLSINWNFRIEKLAKRLESWKFRNLSLKGKSMIINTLALSGLWNTGSIVPLPAWAEKRINRIIFEFLWSGKK